MPTQKTKRETDYLKKVFLFYGIPKIGKSTLISNLGDDKNKVMFFTTESGHKELEIWKWKKHIKDEKGNVVGEGDPTAWVDFKRCADEFTKQSDYRCLAVDTVDILFDWCAQYVLKKKEIEHESDLGYGKGFKLVAREFFPVLNYITQRGYGIFFLSHSQSNDKEFAGKKVTYTDTTLPGTAKKAIHGMCDYIFYLYADQDSKRWIRTKGTDYVNAGDRSGRLSELIPLEKEGTSLKKELTKPEVAQSQQPLKEIDANG